MSMGVAIVRLLVGVMGVGTLVLTLPKLFRRPGAGLPVGFRLPGVALEWAQTPDQFSEIIEKVPHPAAKIRRELWLDSYVVVPLYVAVFIALGLWLREAGRARDALLVGAVAAFSLTAAFFDWRENSSTLSALDAYEGGALNEAVLRRKYRAYVVKWAGIALVMALLAVLSLLGGGPLGGAGLLLSAAVLGIGLARQDYLVEWGYSLMGVGLLLCALGV